MKSPKDESVANDLARQHEEPTRVASFVELTCETLAFAVAQAGRCYFRTIVGSQLLRYLSTE
jgi:hypothetical protein